MKKKYYFAYEDRYKTIHEKGLSWSSDIPTPIVLETIQKYQIQKNSNLLETGCGEGRDAHAILSLNYDLLATDISKEAIDYCQSKYHEYASHFTVLDCLDGKLEKQFDFIYAIAVVHMLVLDKDRNKFYQFIKDHLIDSGLALICSMGDGEGEFQTDINQAFDKVEREHSGGKVMVSATSCRVISMDRFVDELTHNGLTILEKGLTASEPDFGVLIYAIVKKNSD